MQRPPVVGAKRRAPSIRPEVATAVGLCGQPSGSLSPAQIRRLDDIAALLGVRPLTDGDPCAALPAILGDEWTDALALQDMLVEEEARAERNRPNPSALGGTRAIYGTSSRAITPTPIWRNLPPELRIEVVERLADADMRTVVSLYESSVEARDIIDGLRHDALGVDSNGALVYQRVPLIDYARLVTVLGESDPLRLFLAAALCSLRSFADLQVDELDGIEQALGFPRTFGNLADVIATAPPDAPRGPTGRLIYSAFIVDGLPYDELAEAPEEYWETLARGMGPNVDLQAALSGPLASDLPGVVAQWRDWTVDTGDALLTDDNIPHLPIAARYGQILGWFGVSGTVVRYLTDTRYAPLRLTPGDQSLDELVPWRMRWLGVLSREEAASLLGLPPSDPTLAQWSEGRARLDESTVSLQKAIDDGGRNITYDLLKRIAQEAALYPASRACAVTQQRSRLVLAPLENLLAQSVLWLVPLNQDFIGILGDLAAPAFDQALAMARGAPPRT
ncbi:hypothetical protein pqer_cds_61 [Pandoravirus quercus]|uniref:Uncharacterized protein n=1 Tax=Pandoravirus quercus TaxID=2107709 RepID=A0A2U7U7T4_9VIRU|nr:hypothetical protein pqer_cds_61 [Pandoravirus quercus]AVK74483.1 hypothetical protein pqer_cds_61 [Pandoravirus quercus]